MQAPRLPNKCLGILKEICDRNREPLKNGWRPSVVDANCTVHFFILRDYIDDAQDKPSNAAFGQAGMSVQAEGGAFGPLPKHELKMELDKLSASTGKPFVGAVQFLVRDILDEQETFKFRLVHDPHPWRENGVEHEQSPRHVQIVCLKKSTTIRDKLHQLCDWSLRPGEEVIEHVQEDSSSNGPVDSARFPMSDDSLQIKMVLWVMAILAVIAMILLLLHR